MLGVQVAYVTDGRIATVRSSTSCRHNHGEIGAGRRSPESRRGDLQPEQVWLITWPTLPKRTTVKVVG